MLRKIQKAKAIMQRRFQVFAKEEQGDFGIGQLAAIVAAVVIIGVVVTIVTGFLPEWIGTIWEKISDLFELIK